MALWQTFPGPQNLTVNGQAVFDTGIGAHISSGNGGYSDESLRQWYSLGGRWGVLLSLGDEAGDAGGWSRSKTIQAMLRTGIYPISRIYRDTGWQSIPPERAGMHTYSLKKNFAEAGYPDLAPYVQILNEPNLTNEWNDPGRDDAIPDGAPELVANKWYEDALAVLAQGGIPITTPLSPGGAYRDWKFFVRFLYQLKRRGVTAAWMERCAIGVHNYTDNKPLDWGSGSYKKWSLLDFHTADWLAHLDTPPPDYGDTQGFCMWQWYHDAVQDILGADCAVMSCEGGTYPGNGGITYRPKIDAGLHASYITSQMALMMGDRVTDRAVVNDTSLSVPAYVKNTAFWTWGEQPGWAEGNIRTLPETLKRMASITIHPRKQAPIVITPPPTDPPFTLELGFLKYAQDNPLLSITANGKLYFTPDGDAVQRVTVAGKRGFLVWDHDSGKIGHVIPFIQG